MKDGVPLRELFVRNEDVEASRAKRKVANPAGREKADG